MLSSATIFPSKNASGLTVSSELSSHPKPLSKSNVSSKTRQFGGSEMQQQISLLKQKAHQSFMQVIQMQQLHQQQLQQLRRQFQLKEESYQTQLAALESKVRQLEYQNVVLEKNYRQNQCNLEENNFSIGDIDLISCKEESRLDQSSFYNLCDIVTSQTYQEQYHSLRQDLKKELKAITTQNTEQLKKVQVIVNKVFEYVAHLKKELVTLQDMFVQAKKQLAQSQNRVTHFKTIYETQEKQTFLRAEQVNRLIAQKVKRQQRISQLQHKLNQHEKGLRNQNCIENKLLLTKNLAFKKTESNQSNDKSLDINQFIRKKIAKTKEQLFLRAPVFPKKVKG